MQEILLIFLLSSVLQTLSFLYQAAFDQTNKSSISQRKSSSTLPPTSRFISQSQGRATTLIREKWIKRIFNCKDHYLFLLLNSAGVIGSSVSSNEVEHSCLHGKHEKCMPGIV